MLASKFVPYDESENGAAEFGDIKNSTQNNADNEALG